MAGIRPIRFLLLALLLLAASYLVFRIVDESPPVGASPASASPQMSLPEWGVDFRLAPQPLDDTIANTAGKEADNPETPGFEIEKNLSLAVSPLNPNMIVGAYERLRLDNGYYYGQYASSSDGGRTWQSGAFDQIYFGDLLTHQGPTVTFDYSGTAYYGILGESTTQNGYMVFTSTNGLTWSQPLPLTITNYNEYRFHGEVAADPNPPGQEQYAGSLYFAYGYNHVADPYQTGLIRIQYSRDGGVTWSHEIQVSDPNIEYGDKPTVVIASDGTLYVAYTQVDGGFVLNDRRLFIDRSTDGGQTWGTDYLVTGAPIVPAGGPDFELHELVLPDSSDCRLVRINHFPVIGVSPTNSNEVYATWNDGRWDLEESLCGPYPTRHSDIAFSRSTDAGATWSAPVRVNDDVQGDGIDQFQPSMKVAPDGTIAMTWYDRRYSSDPYDVDLAYSQSTDGGLTWSPNMRVSDQSSDPKQISDGKGIDDLGYKSSIAVGPDYVLPGWIDTRDASRQGHIYVDRGTLASPPPSPTPSITPSPSATSSSTPTATPTACTISFSDVPEGSTFYPYVQCLACRGIINGYGDGTFRPNSNVTRGQLSKIVSNAAGFADEVSGQSFEDVAPGSTFYTYTERLYARGVMAGYACGGVGEPCGGSNLPYFRPNNNATRGQISKIVSQAAGYNDPAGVQIFEDVPPGSTFYDYVQRLASRGYMSGYPCGGAGDPCGPGQLPYFRPNNNATRGQVAKIVSNTFFPECAVAR